MSWNQVPSIVFVIKCVEMIWNQVSRIDFWNHKSWNQIFIIGFGITSLGIKCPALVLESQVLESNVRNWFWNHKSWNQMSGIGFGITSLGIICLGIRCPKLVLSSCVK